MWRKAGLLLVILLGLTNLRGQKVGLRGGPTATGGPTGTLVRSSQLSLDGCFLTPFVNTGHYTTSYPMATRKIGGQRYYEEFSGDGHIYEFPEPALSPCTGFGFDGVNQAVITTDYGVIPTFANSAGYIPAAPFTAAFGMTWDLTNNVLLIGWTNYYTNVPSGINSYASVTLNGGATPSMTLNGCFSPGIDVPMGQGGSGVLQLPAKWLSIWGVPLAARYGVGLGGYITGVTSAPSLGPAIRAVVPPPNNPCATGTDYVSPSYTTLMAFAVNSNGPVCYTVGLGCTPSQPPTPPYPQQLGNLFYSDIAENINWEPWVFNGTLTGWYTANAAHSIDLYDDGTVFGFVEAYEMTEGWMNTLIQASPAPTVDACPSNQCHWSFTVASTSTHDGNNINPGDGPFWIPTCAVGIDAGCTNGQGEQVSFAIADTVNPATGVITAHGDPGFGPDGCTSCPHLPQVGQPVLLGGLYAHASPTFTRGTFRLKIIDPNLITQVVAQRLRPDSVTSAEDVEIDNTLVRGFGSPSNLVNGGVINNGQGFGRNPVTLMADPTRQQIMIEFLNAGPANTDVVYVLHVNH